MIHTAYAPMPAHYWPKVVAEKGKFRQVADNTWETPYVLTFIWPLAAQLNSWENEGGACLREN